MDESKSAINAAIAAIEASYADAPDFRKTQALEHLGQALHALEQTADKIPAGQPVDEG